MTIDWWTLGLQTINVAVLIWLLGRFFWKPLATMIEQRRAAAEQILAEAEAKRGESTAALAEIEKTRAGFTQERDRILATARDEAEVVRTARLAKAEAEAAALQAAATAGIEKDKGVVLEAVSAAALDPADQDQYRDAIGAAFGAKPKITFKTDPALIAGLELRGPTLVISNSWQADLTHILADLAHDRR